MSARGFPPSDGAVPPKLSIALEMPPELVEIVAQRAAQIVASRDVNTASPWLSVAEAADWLRCHKDRIYDLIASRKLSPRRDGRRVLLHRDDLDAYLESGR